MGGVDALDAVWTRLFVLTSTSITTSERLDAPGCALRQRSVLEINPADLPRGQIRSQTPFKHLRLVVEKVAQSGEKVDARHRKQTPFVKGWTPPAEGLLTVDIASSGEAER